MTVPVLTHPCEPALVYPNGNKTSAYFVLAVTAQDLGPDHVAALTTQVARQRAG